MQSKQNLFVQRVESSGEWAGIITAISVKIFYYSSCLNVIDSIICNLFNAFVCLRYDKTVYGRCWLSINGCETKANDICGYRLIDNTQITIGTLSEKGNLA